MKTDGKFDNKIIGQYFIKGSLIRHKCSIFLSGTLPSLVSVIYCYKQFQHDGCSVHYAQQTRQVLQRLVCNCWIGRGGQPSWPAQSLDFTPLNCLLWGHLKNEVYYEPPIRNLNTRLEHVMM